MNMLKHEKRGCGIRIKFDEISEEKLTKTLNELLNDPKYSENAQILAKRFRDRPLSASETVVYWTEYVARHNGAHFLQAVGNEMNFMQFHLIDIYFALALVIIIVFGMLRKLIKVLYQTVMRDEKLKKKKNL